MVVEQVELPVMAIGLAEGDEGVGSVILDLRIEPETSGADRNQCRRRLRVARGEERHIVPAPDELLRQERNDPFRSAIQRRWHRLHQRGQDSDPQCTFLLRDPSIGVGQVSRRGLTIQDFAECIVPLARIGLTGGPNHWLHDSCPVRRPRSPESW